MNPPLMRVTSAGLAYRLDLPRLDLVLVDDGDVDIGIANLVVCSCAPPGDPAPALGPFLGVKWFGIDPSHDRGWRSKPLRHLFYAMAEVSLDLVVPSGFLGVIYEPYNLKMDRLVRRHFIARTLGTRPYHAVVVTRAALIDGLADVEPSGRDALSPPIEWLGDTDDLAPEL